MEKTLENTMFCVVDRRLSRQSDSNGVEESKGAAGRLCEFCGTDIYSTPRTAAFGLKTYKKWVLFVAWTKTAVIANLAYSKILICAEQVQNFIFFLSFFFLPARMSLMLLTFSVNWISRDRI